MLQSAAHNETMIAQPDHEAGKPRGKTMPTKARARTIRSITPQAGSEATQPHGMGSDCQCLLDYGSWPNVQMWAGGERVEPAEYEAEMARIMRQKYVKDYPWEGEE